MLRGVVTLTREEVESIKKGLSQSHLLDRLSTVNTDLANVELSAEDIEVILDLDIEMPLRTKLVEVLNNWRYQSQ